MLPIHSRRTATTLIYQESAELEKAWLEVPSPCCRLKDLSFFVIFHRPRHPRLICRPPHCSTLSPRFSQDSQTYFASKRSQRSTGFFHRPINILLSRSSSSTVLILYSLLLKESESFLVIRRMELHSLNLSLRGFFKNSSKLTRRQRDFKGLLRASNVFLERIYRVNCE